MGTSYSTNYGGGTNGAGTVYSLSTTGGANVIYNFDTTHGGWGYAPLVQDAQGNLYGTEAQGGTLGGGVVFKVTTGGSITTLSTSQIIVRANRMDVFRSGGLVLGSDKNLYGSTYRGGANNDGVLFKLTTSGTYTQLATLDGSDGAATESTPIQLTNGTIYGVTSTGGAYGGGVLIQSQCWIEAVCRSPDLTPVTLA